MDPIANNRVLCILKFFTYLKCRERKTNLLVHSQGWAKIKPEAKNSIPTSQMHSRHSSTCIVSCCLGRCITRKLSQNWNPGTGTDVLIQDVGVTSCGSTHSVTASTPSLYLLYSIFVKVVDLILSILSTIKKSSFCLVVVEIL